jgi:hypothetical protein
MVAVAAIGRRKAREEEEDEGVGGVGGGSAHQVTHAYEGVCGAPSGQPRWCIAPPVLGGARVPIGRPERTSAMAVPHSSSTPYRHHPKVTHLTAPRAPINPTPPPTSSNVTGPLLRVRRLPLQLHLLTMASASTNAPSFSSSAATVPRPGEGAPGDYGAKNCDSLVERNRED